MWKWMVVVLLVLALGSSAYAVDYDSLLQTAKAKALSGDFAGAVIVCNGIVIRHLGAPIEPRALLLLGNIMSRRRDSAQDVITQFCLVADRFPNSPEAAEALLRIGYLHDRLKQPSAEWDRIVANYPAAKEAPEALLRIAYREDRLGQDASADWGKLARNYPTAKEAIEAWRCLGQLALRRSDPDLAISSFQHSADMSSIDSDGAEAGRVELGYAYISRFWARQDSQSLTQAISTLAPVLKSQSQDRVVRARLGRGEAFLVLGIPGRALMEYQAALDLQPTNAYLTGIAQFESGVCYDGMDAYAKAEAAFGEFLAGIPGADLSTKSAGWCNSRPDFTKVVARDPAKAYGLTGVDLVARAACRRAVALHKLRRDQEAKALVRDISTAFPDLAATTRSAIED